MKKKILASAVLVTITLMVMLGGCNRTDAGLSDSDAGLSDIGVGLSDITVTLNPSGFLPLTARLDFSTRRPARVTVTVPGKGGPEGEGEKALNTWTRTYPVGTSHKLNIMGLYAGSTNTVTVQALGDDGLVETKTVEITTAPMPEYFPDYELSVVQPEQMEPGWTLVETVSGAYTVVLDYNGDIRWYTRSRMFALSKERFIVALNSSDTEWGEVDWTGVVHQRYHLPMGIHHDAITLPNGNLLAASALPRDTINDVIIEYDKDTGEQVRVFDLREFFPQEYVAYDPNWAHNNSLWYDESDDTLIVSLRTLSMVVKLAYPTGEVKWALCGDYDYVSPEWKERYLLRPLNADFRFQVAQHAAMKLDDIDNNPDTIDIMLFNNNAPATQSRLPTSEYPYLGTYSEGRHVRINEKNMTVEDVWAYGREMGTKYYCSALSDANRYSGTGNYLLTFCRGMSNGEVVCELTRDKQTVFELQIDAAGGYRSDRIVF
ncbi:MAG: aryl-sulfate sulfotransferase [Spirochaetaceae bacterium]|jgi:arylsulfate sulfotransferase|nr:aryl-sulfate sulfotransferase [Spirochaetaceae bacterium]